MSGQTVTEDLSHLARKEVFTTGEAADLCRVSQQTIIRCFDSGRLVGFRVPGSRFRRIPRNNLIRFMREEGIPLGVLGASSRLLLAEAELSEEMTKRGLTVQHVSDLFSCGREVAGMSSGNTLIVQLEALQGSLKQTMDAFVACAEQQGLQLIALTTNSALANQWGDRSKCIHKSTLSLCVHSLEQHLEAQGQ